MENANAILDSSVMTVPFLNVLLTVILLMELATSHLENVSAQKTTKESFVKRRSAKTTVLETGSANLMENAFVTSTGLGKTAAKNSVKMTATNADNVSKGSATVFPDSKASLAPLKPNLILLWNVPHNVLTCV